MKKYLTYAATAFFAMIAFSIAAPDEEAIKTKETATWQAFKDKNVDEFKKLLSPHMVATYAEGSTDFQGELASMRNNALKSFVITELKATSTDSDTIITTYKVEYIVARGGKDSSGTEYGASVWRKMEGDWKMIFRTNIKAQPAAK
jgi:hypothetical protein